MSVTLIVDYYELNLEQEVRRRAKDNNRFEEQELWYILGSLAEVLSQWQANKFYHGDINCYNVGMTQTGELKLWDNAVVSQHHNSLVKALSNRNHCYLSPIQMEGYQSRNMKIQYDHFKSDVFSLGMTMLHAAQLKSSSNYYLWDKGSIAFHKIEEDLRELARVYSQTLVHTIQEMLQVNSDLRVDFITLNAQVNRNSGGYTNRILTQPLKQSVIRQSIVQEPVIIRQEPQII